MTQNFLLSGTLTDFQLKLLDLIQHLYQEAKGANRIASRNKEPVITLQYADIIAFQLFTFYHQNSLRPPL